MPEHVRASVSLPLFLPFCVFLSLSFSLGLRLLPLTWLFTLFQLLVNTNFQCRDHFFLLALFTKLRWTQEVTRASTGRDKATCFQNWLNWGSLEVFGFFFFNMDFPVYLLRFCL